MVHEHHIIPLYTCTNPACPKDRKSKHICGLDDPSNLIELTIEEHAEVHKQLWLMDRNWEDEIAYLSLSGQIGQEEATLMAIRVANTGIKNARYGKPGTMLGRKGKNHPMFGKKIIGRKSVKRSEETKEKIRQTLLGKKHSIERVEKNRQGQLCRYGRII
jgi:hypothetical protein